MGRQILLVDDERALLSALGLYLEGAGYQILTTENAETALGILMLYRPDAIVCDLHMPGMNGFALFRKIRQNPELQTVRLILLTGTGESSDLDQGQDLRIDGYLAKPFEPEELLAILESA
jgi:CheY-like chemotaxis protein